MLQRLKEYGIEKIFDLGFVFFLNSIQAEGSFSSCSTTHQLQNVVMYLDFLVLGFFIYKM